MENPLVQKLSTAANVLSDAMGLKLTDVFDESTRLSEASRILNTVVKAADTLSKLYRNVAEDSMHTNGMGCLK